MPSTKKKKSNTTLERFSIWLEKETIAELEAISKNPEVDRPIGYLIRRAVEEYVKNWKAQ